MQDREVHMDQRMQQPGAFLCRVECIELAHKHPVVYLPQAATADTHTGNTAP